jgi:hypothetical protein
MRQISSKLTFLYKRVFPAVWFGVLALFVGIVLIVCSAAERWPPLPFLLVPAAIALFGYLVMDKLVFDLVDEVLDDKDGLIIKNHGQQERVDLHDIVKVGFTRFVNPPRVTLSLKRPGSFGSQVSFCPPVWSSLFAPSPIARELSQRIEGEHPV